MLEEVTPLIDAEFFFVELLVGHASSVTMMLSRTAQHA
jgi:hypothetical protein